MPASFARCQTWTIIGRPAISASGLFGRRVEARRAGIRTTGFMGRIINCSKVGRPRHYAARKLKTSLETLAETALTGATGCWTGRAELAKFRADCRARSPPPDADGIP